MGDKVLEVELLEELFIYIRILKFLMHTAELFSELAEIICIPISSQQSSIFPLPPVKTDFCTFANLKVKNGKSSGLFLLS